MPEADATEWTGDALLDLRETENLSYTDLAHRTGLPRSTVYNRVQRADSDAESPDERTVRVYLPSTSDRARWQQAANERGVSLSRLVRDSVETHLAEPRGPNPKEEVARLQARLDDAHDRIQHLEKERDRYRKLLDKQDDELEALREQGTTPQEPSLRATINPDVMDFLREHGRLRRQDLPTLGIDPDSPEAATIITHMETLERLGVVEPTTAGWRL